MYEGDAKYGLTYDHTGNRVILHILGVVKTAENSQSPNLGFGGKPPFPVNVVKGDNVELINELGDARIYQHNDESFCAIIRIWRGK
ncbi:hypothetical protein [Commensalibacter melissae]|uniref:hypothetical protein n=1 Tax=Commensalibacter melissae TaxID=2070537 RepID=UPI0012D8D260|nr:hypothetical protein [Commensalibacter melissae]MUH05455.1 hypothetical protein [Commensalibacter melissae]